MRTFPSLSFSLVGSLWGVLTSRCHARRSIHQIWKRWQGRRNAYKLSSSMLAPCNLLVRRDDSLNSRILAQRWLGLVTLGGLNPSFGQIKQVMLTSRAVTEWMQNTWGPGIIAQLNMVDFCLFVFLDHTLLQLAGLDHYDKVNHVLNWIKLAASQVSVNLSFFNSLILWDQGKYFSQVWHFLWYFLDSLQTWTFWH